VPGASLGVDARLIPGIGQESSPTARKVNLASTLSSAVVHALKYMSFYMPFFPLEAPVEALWVGKGHTENGIIFLLSTIFI
jgi:hypothetical protein